MWKFILLIIIPLVSSLMSRDDILDSVERKLRDIMEDLRLRHIVEDCMLDCSDWYNNGHNKSGVYIICPLNRVIRNRPLLVFCDMSTDGGGWTVIQRRGNFGKHHWYFYKDWLDYKIGFGDIKKDFWLGNDNIFALTNQKSYSLRIDLKDQEKNQAYAEYKQFWIDDENHKYMLHIQNFSGGNAGDAMSFHNNLKFSTSDQDNDLDNATNCATKYTAAWWYGNCYKANLNGVYDSPSFGIQYNTWKIQPLYWTEIKIKPDS